MTTNPFLLKTFDEKLDFLLHYIYENGGSEYIGQSFSSHDSYGLCGCDNPGQFKRIMDALISKKWVTFDNVTETAEAGGNTFYFGTILTEAGIQEVKKKLPQLPMLSLLNSKIETGDNIIDSKINHARELFVREPTTMDNMRSACEALSFVLEPLRKDLKTVIADADVEHFFHLINKFDIRHNNDFTKTLHHPEQLEWVFYSLLNTINAYTKLKSRLNL